MTAIFKFLSSVSLCGVQSHITYSLWGYLNSPPYFYKATFQCTFQTHWIYKMCPVNFCRLRVLVISFSQNVSPPSHLFCGRPSLFVINNRAFVKSFVFTMRPHFKYMQMSLSLLRWPWAEILKAADTNTSFKETRHWNIDRFSISFDNLLLMFMVCI